MTQNVREHLPTEAGLQHLHHTRADNYQYVDWKSTGALNLTHLQSDQ